MKNAKTII